MRYAIIVLDNEIPVCEVKFNDQDLANIIGEQLTRLIANIMPPPEPEDIDWLPYK